MKLAKGAVQANVMKHTRGGQYLVFIFINGRRVSADGRGQSGVSATWPAVARAEAAC